MKADQWFTVQNGGLHLKTMKAEDISRKLPFFLFSSVFEPLSYPIALGLTHHKREFDPLQGYHSIEDRSGFNSSVFPRNLKSDRRFLTHEHFLGIIYKFQLLLGLQRK